jgi:AcrR family transcriptional regulator
MEQLDLRVQKTYKALVEAFERLLLEKEFESISVTEICDAAMIRRPTFYKHFLDKYDFITFFIKHKMNKIFDFAIQKSNDEGVLEYCEQIEPPVRMIEPASAINRATQCNRESH